MNRDVDIRLPDIRFAAVARAVILINDRVLLARSKRADHSFLPGGHLQINEPTQAGLARELHEELGLTASVGEYLGAIESWWEDNVGSFGAAGRTTHQIDHYFAVSISDPGEDPLPAARESHLEFFWWPVIDLSECNLLPEPLRQFIPRFAMEDHRIWWSTSSNST